MPLQVRSGVRAAILQLKCILENSSLKQGIRTLSSEVSLKSNNLFNNEQKRQLEAVGRVEKIRVEVLGPPEDVTLIMNAGISTPFDCAQHVSKPVMERSALALLDSNMVYDMHRPLMKDCTVQFLHFTDKDPFLLNKAFWRTCSVLLGAVVTSAFKDTITVLPHSFPVPTVKSGSFVYDVLMGLEDWKPAKDELRILSAQMVTLAKNALKCERLCVNEELAKQIFEGNPLKVQQIPNVASSSADGKITLYRIGNYIDISAGPLISDTSFLGRCTITAVHPIDTDDEKLYRFQGVALPKGVLLNHFAYSIIEKRGEILNAGRIPGEPFKPQLEATLAK